LTCQRTGGLTCGVVVRGCPLLTADLGWFAAPARPRLGHVGGHGRRLGSRAARIKLTVGGLAPSASAQEAADQPKPNRYDHDIGEQRWLRHLSGDLLRRQNGSSVRPRPRTQWSLPVELLPDERNWEAMLQPLMAERPGTLLGRSKEPSTRRAARGPNTMRRFSALPYGRPNGHTSPDCLLKGLGRRLDGS
jgi:hypothetical protein